MLEQAGSPRLRFAAASLNAAFDDLAALLAERFLSVSADDRDSVFRAYAEDHRTSPAAS